MPLMRHRHAPYAPCTRYECGMGCGLARAALYMCNVINGLHATHGGLGIRRTRRCTHGGGTFARGYVRDLGSGGGIRYQSTVLFTPHNATFSSPCNAAVPQCNAIVPINPLQRVRPRVMQRLRPTNEGDTAWLFRSNGLTPWGGLLGVLRNPSLLWLAGVRKIILPLLWRFWAGFALAHTAVRC